MAKVSVIIPCFNRADLVGQAIESALGQSHDDVEVVVVDDGSTDSSWDEISGFGDRIVKVRVENGGVCRARNIGIGHATGTFVKFLDSDDLLERDAIAGHLTDLARSAENSVVVGTAVSIDGGGAVIADTPYNAPHSRDGSEMTLQMLLSFPIQVSLPLYPAAAVRSVGGFRETITLSEDYDLNLRAWRAGYRFFLFDTPSSRIRDHGGDRLTSGPGARAFAGMTEMWRDHLAAFESGDGHRLSRDERLGFARWIWSRARRAVRLGHDREARRMFSLAEEIAGRDARLGSPVARLLYRVADPVFGAKLVDAAKRVIGRG